MSSNAIEITPTNNKKVRAGAGCKFDFVLYDTSDTPTALVKASLESVEMTLKNKCGQVINGRENTDVLDAAIGTVSTAGVVTLKFTPDDNPSTEAGVYFEWHFLQLAWTWTDGDGFTWTDSEHFKFKVHNLVMS